jgi:hypothetical protein
MTAPTLEDQKNPEPDKLTGQHIRAYDVSGDDCDERVILVLDECGDVVSGFVAGCDMDARIVEAKDIYESGRDSSGYDLPFMILRHPDFDEDLEYEPWRGDNHECYRDSIDRFFRYATGLDDHSALSALVRGHESCLEFDRFDMSLGARLLEERILGKVWSLSAEEACEALIGLNGRPPAPWLKDCIPKDTVIDAMRLAITMTKVGYRSLLAMDDVLPFSMDGIDARYILGRFGSYYEADSAIRKMASRGRMSTASVLARALGDMRISDDCPLDLARLYCLLGLPDNDDLYIDAFLQDPNSKRLDEALRAHPKYDRQELIDMVWRPEEFQNAQRLLFFARNGMYGRVSDLILSDGCRNIDPLMDDDIDGLFQLGEVLLDNGCTTATAEICRHMLEFGKRSRDSFDSVARVMWLMDDVCDDPACPEWAEDYCAEYSRHWKAQSLWDAYGSPASPHFTQGRRRYRDSRHRACARSCYPRSSSSTRTSSRRISLPGYRHRCP